MGAELTGAAQRAGLTANLPAAAIIISIIISGGGSGSGGGIMIVIALATCEICSAPAKPKSSPTKREAKRTLPHSQSGLLSRSLCGVMCLPGRLAYKRTYGR